MYLARNFTKERKLRSVNFAWATHEKVSACARCGVLFTLPVAYKGIAVSCKRNSRKKTKNTDVLPTVEKTTMWMTLSNLSKTTPMKTTNSIATGFPILDIGEFVGWEELEGPPFRRGSPVVSEQSDLAFVGPARPCVFKASFQLFPYLRQSVRSSAGTFVPYDGLQRFFVRFAVGTAGGFSKTTLCMVILAWSVLSWSTMTCLLFFFLKTKWRMVSAWNLPLVNRVVNSVGIKHVPQVQWTMPSVQYLSTVCTLDFRRDLEQFVAFHVSHIVNHLFRFFAEGIITCDYSSYRHLSRLCLDDHWLDAPIFFNRIRLSSSCSPAACETPWTLKSILGCIFPSSASGPPVQARRWWWSSCRNCQASNFGWWTWRKRSFLILNLHFFKTVGCNRVMKDNGILSGLQECWSFLLSNFEMDPMFRVLAHFPRVLHGTFRGFVTLCQQHLRRELKPERHWVKE